MRAGASNGPEARAGLDACREATFAGTMMKMNLLAKEEYQRRFDYALSPNHVDP